jgi:glycine cleavage system H protein
VIESAKWVGPFRSPLSGEVLETNAGQFATDPGIVNRDPFGAGWLVRLAPSGLQGERVHLLDGVAAFPLVRARIEAEQISCMRCAE